MKNRTQTELSQSNISRKKIPEQLTPRVFHPFLSSDSPPQRQRRGEAGAGTTLGAGKDVPKASAFGEDMAISMA